MRRGKEKKMVFRDGELSKADSKQLKGLAILFMVLLHLFCRKSDLPYSDVTVWNVPLSYFFGLFGDQCVAIYCFCSGYAHALLRSAAVDGRAYLRASLCRLLRFLVRFWVVVLVFSGVGLLVQSPDIPRSISDLLGNLFLYRLNYNGAWWFVLTYCLLTLLSASLFRLCQRLHPVLLTIVFFGLYAVGYIYRFRNPLQIENPFLSTVCTQCALLCTSLFPYMIGMMFFKYKWITALRCFFNEKKISAHLLRAAALTVTIVMMVMHRIVEGLYVSVFISVVTVVLFAVVPLTKAENSALLFFGGHSTNIWLIHMFFYLTLFRDFVFLARWPILIFILMLVICVAVSYVLQVLQNGVQKLLRL